VSRRARGRLRRLRIIPVTYRTACEFVCTHDRHLAPPQGHKFSLGLIQPGGHLVGVAMVGRPVARHLDDGLTAQVTRLCTDTTPHACCALLAAAWRTARAMGYQQMITYIRADEPGTSLRAAGWHPVAARLARPGWDRPARPRTGGSADNSARLLWRVTVADTGRRRGVPRDLTPPDEANQPDGPGHDAGGWP
jgi:hypothetical protein